MVFDDGLGSRYEFPKQMGVDSIIIINENTKFNLTDDHLSLWILCDWDIYKHLCNTSKFSEIDALTKRNHSSLAQTYIPVNAANTPVIMRTKDCLHLSFHETALTDYAGMTLKINADNLSMTCNLIGSDPPEI